MACRIVYSPQGPVGHGQQRHAEADRESAAFAHQHLIAVFAEFIQTRKRSDDRFAFAFAKPVNIFVIHYDKLAQDLRFVFYTSIVSNLQGHDCVSAFWIERAVFAAGISSSAVDAVQIFLARIGAFRVDDEEFLKGRQAAGVFGLYHGRFAGERFAGVVNIPAVDADEIAHFKRGDTLDGNIVSDGAVGAMHRDPAFRRIRMLPSVPAQFFLHRIPFLDCSIIVDFG